jgi:microcystin-dependent protein
LDYWGSATPNSSFAFPTGQAISRTTYATLFSLIGTTYGSGDGSTTFNLPDKTGRVSAMKEAAAVRLTSTYFGGNSTSLGAVGGAESQTLTLAQLPTGITSDNPSPITATLSAGASKADTSATGGGTVVAGTGAVTIATIAAHAAAVTSTNTNGNAHPIVQPTIVCNYILRII